MRKVFLSLALLSAIAGCYCTLLSWEELSVSGLARARWFAGTAVAGGKLYLFGGQGNPTGNNDTGILGECLLASNMLTAKSFSTKYSYKTA